MIVLEWRRNRQQPSERRRDLFIAVRGLAVDAAETLIAYAHVYVPALLIPAYAHHSARRVPELFGIAPGNKVTRREEIVEHPPRPIWDIENEVLFEDLVSVRLQEESVIV